ncbi:hypothetical protein Glove_421g135 [Diversispora epigaea]|uniref:Protein kinase domain-containing protein n=1 Tax=Diversispora epigaea TaxID=1348612 RepID=A0A397GWA3_9GLOM|nr:hypothetical protein Glove_421g135 [Diversispora epigaea]
MEGYPKNIIENEKSPTKNEKNFLLDVLQKCRQKNTAPNNVIEWIEYDLTEGGCATIYTSIGRMDTILIVWVTLSFTLDSTPDFFAWRISDLGFSDQLTNHQIASEGISYIAPEVLCSEIYTTKPDIFSTDILMWEVIKAPFDSEYEHDFDLVLDIVKDVDKDL